MTGVFCPAKGRKWKLKVWPREKDVDINGRQVKYLRMTARLLPFRMTEIKLMMVFICVQESASKNMLVDELL
jgi:hypothetical protein